MLLVVKYVIVSSLIFAAFDLYLITQPERPSTVRRWARALGLVLNLYIAFWAYGTLPGAV
jgi:hypothetical protein